MPQTARQAVSPGHCALVASSPAPAAEYAPAAQPSCRVTRGLSLAYSRRVLVLWQLMRRPGIALAYAMNLIVRARRGIFGPRRYPGDARRIMRASISDCWDGRCLTASVGHFHQFWTRDLCFSSVALARLSDRHRDAVLRSLDWAMRTWRRRDSHVTTTIHYFDQPVDIFDYGVDCLPFLLAALHRLGAGDLLERNQAWLTGEVAHYLDQVVDSGTSLVRADRMYSAHRDTMVNRCNAYGNAMVALLAKTLRALEWDVPTPLIQLAEDPARLLMTEFWDERGFFVDERRDTRPSGEGNIWPFWTGVVTDPALLRQALAALESHGLTDPLPLKYESVRHPESEPPLIRFLMPDYQGATVWTSLGSMYMRLRHSVDPAPAQPAIDRFREWIEHEGVFWEVMDDETRRRYWSSFVTQSDEGMLWSAIFLDLLAHPELPPPVLS